MKRFLVFFWDTYYPRGGMNDFRADFDTYGEALDFCARNEADNKEIYDMQERRTCFAKGLDNLR